MPLYKGARSMLKGAQMRVNKQQDHLLKALIELDKLLYS
jgi:hypothetical protein